MHVAGGFSFKLLVGGLAVVADPFELCGSLATNAKFLIIIIKIASYGS